MEHKIFNTKNHSRLYNRVSSRWIRFWSRFSGVGPIGRLASRAASWMAPPHKARVFLARRNPRGFVEPTATIYHANLKMGPNVFIGEHAVVFEGAGGGEIELGARVNIFRHSVLETAHGGRLILEEDSSVHPRCQLNAYKATICIGKGTMLAPNCALYPYDHGLKPGLPIREQPIQSKGDIIIGREAWLGVGVIVLGGVTIGDGAVVAAGSVVTQSIPDQAIAMGSPATVVKMR